MLGERVSKHRPFESCKDIRSRPRCEDSLTQMQPHVTRWAVIGLISAVLGGCAAGGGDRPSFSLPDMSPTVASIAAAPDDDPKGSSVELYTRIASGANACWFGGSGSLKSNYIYHAEADAPSRGGKAEIIIHERDPSSANPRGPRAYRIAITPVDESSAHVATENLKINAPLATAMTADVDRWSRGEQGCSGNTAALGWSPERPAAPAPTATTKAAKKKAKAPVRP